MATLPKMVLIPTFVLESAHLNSLQMKKYFLYLFTLATMFFFSCENKELDASVRAEKPEIQRSRQDWVDVLSKNASVKVFLSNNQAFINKHDAWLAALPEKERLSYKQQIKRSIDAGRAITIDMRFIAPADQEAHYAYQQKAIDDVKKAYPAFAQLDAEERATIFVQVLKKATASQKVNSVDCHAGYNACSWACHDAGGASSCHAACWAGYLACSQDPCIE